LTRQAREAGLEPVYILEVPPTETQPLHSLGDLKE
jgi:hypothetical protein